MKQKTIKNIVSFSGKGIHTGVLTNVSLLPAKENTGIVFVRKDLVHNLKDFPYKLSDDPYDYIELYSHLCLWDNEWYTNNILIVNKAIGDYYLQKKEKVIKKSF